jgi:hypothetical protein
MSPIGRHGTVGPAGDQNGAFELEIEELLDQGRPAT